MHTYYYSRGIQASLGQGFPFSDEKLSKVYFLFGFLTLQSVSPDVAYANDGIYSLVCNTLEGKLVEGIGWTPTIGGDVVKNMCDHTKKCWGQK